MRVSLDYDLNGNVSLPDGDRSLVYYAKKEQDSWRVYVGIPAWMPELWVRIVTMYEAVQESADVRLDGMMQGDGAFMPSGYLWLRFSVPEKDEAPRSMVHTACQNLVSVIASTKYGGGVSVSKRCGEDG